ncbi:hypothetical protein Halru_0567 [Halovivax ruber XH-70]|uniref:Uncharacterized protein n=1 Tax=Halovivax ruber (strain DSM 18193 / JCM 13892 / XH-70) TaxID=797302 RepID=L0I6M8_HALRX|nr:hypothetical protein [Halovivax ruber]AGB15200.1 hypothetical protein Halru_0567 [Halovivax ruber XH-70]
MTADHSDDGVLDPDDLQLDPDHVERIEDNRFIVKPGDSDDRPAAGDASSPLDTDSAARDPDPVESLDPDPTGALAADPAPHGVDISLKTDGEVARHRNTSADIREVFADMMAWYATQLDEDVTPMEALEVLIATTDLDERI